MKDIAIWKEKLLESEERCKTIAIEEETKASERLQKELSIIKKRFGEAEEDYKSQIAKLNKLLKEKEDKPMDGVENQRRQLREERQAKERQDEIKRLQTNIQKMREEHLKVVDEKNGEISRVKDKFK